MRFHRGFGILPGIAAAQLMKYFLGANRAIEPRWAMRLSIEFGESPTNPCPRHHHVFGVNADRIDQATRGEFRDRCMEGIVF